MTKTLFFDIETTPYTVLSFGLGKQYIPYDNIVEDRRVICIAYKWEGEKKIHLLKFDVKNPDNDIKMIKKFSDVYRKADKVIGHNIEHFDIAVLLNYIVKYRLDPLRPTIIDDSYLGSKRIGFASHRLDYIAQYLGVGKKKPHPFSLWFRVCAGEQKAVDEMGSYCMGDVDITERVYNILKPYMKVKLNNASDGIACPSCDKVGNFKKDGFKYSASGKKRQVYQCLACRHYSLGSPEKLPTKPLQSAA